MAISSKWRLFLRDLNGKRQLKHVTNHSVTDESTSTNVAGPEEVIDTIRGTGGFSISLTSRKQAEANLEADWFGLRDDDERIAIEIQYLGAGGAVTETHIFSDCRVANANVSGDSAGEVTIEVAVTAPRRQIVR